MLLTVARARAVMERCDLDTAAIQYRDTGHRDLLNKRVGSALGGVQTSIRSRPGYTADSVNHDPATGRRRATIQAEYGLSEQQLLDLLTMHLADWLQQVNQTSATTVVETKMSYARGGAPGHWVIPPQGFHAMRREAWQAMAEVCGGNAWAMYDRIYRQLDASAGAPAFWQPGEMTASELEAWDGRGSERAKL